MATILYINSKDITTPCILLQTLKISKFKIIVHFSLSFDLWGVYTELKIARSKSK